MKMSRQMPVCEIASPESQTFFRSHAWLLFFLKAFCKSCSAAAMDLVIAVWEFAVICVGLNKDISCLHKSTSRNI